MRPSIQIILATVGILALLLLVRLYNERRPSAAPAAPTPAQTLVAAVPTIMPTAPAAGMSSASPAAQETRVDVGGYDLFLTCVGVGSPTIVLEAGLGADHTTWDGVQPALAQFTRVCSYDRAGLGQSEIAPTPRTSEQVANDLHALLIGAGVSAPYLLVGHSFGGLHVRSYASQYPDEIVGMVLIDAVHEDWWDRARAALPPATTDDSPRLQGFREFLTVDWRDPAKNAEGIDIPASAAQVRNAGSLGTIPLLVITAGQPGTLAPGLPPDLEAKLNQLMQEELQGELVQLSSQHIHILASESGHLVHQDQPDLVVQAIGMLVEIVQKKG